MHVALSPATSVEAWGPSASIFTGASLLLHQCAMSRIASTSLAANCGSIAASIFTRRSPSHMAAMTAPTRNASGWGAIQEACALGTE